MAKGEGLKQLKRLFGDDAVTAEGENYILHFPLDLPPDFDADSAFLEYKEYDPHAADKDDEGTTLNRKHYDNDVPPAMQAFSELINMRIFGRGEIKHYNTADEGIVSISKYAAEQKLVVDRLKRIPDDDDYFRRLADKGHEDDHGHGHDDDDHHEATDATPQTPAQRVVASLNALHDQTRWQVDEFPLVKGGKNELVIATTGPVANPMGAAFFIAEALEIPTAEITKPVNGRVVLPLAQLLDHEAQLDNLDSLDARKFERLLAPGGIGGLGAAGGKK